MQYFVRKFTLLVFIILSLYSEKKFTRANENVGLDAIENSFLKDENPMRPNITNTTVLSSCSTQVEWNVQTLEEGIRIIDHFLIVWRNSEDTKTSSQEISITEDKLCYSYVINDLLPETNYVITVSSYLDNEEVVASQPSNDTTSASITPPEITRLVALNTRDTKTTLIWNTAFNYSCLLEFKINWTSQILWDNDTTSNGNTKTTKKKDTITNLVPYSSNTFCVYASSIDEVEGLMSCTTEQTDQGKPGEPIALESETNSSSTIEVSWKKPADVNGILSHYVVSWQNHENVEHEDTKNTTDTNLFLKDLLDCGLYSISVSASTQLGSLVGDPARTTATTFPTYPTPPVSDFEASVVKPHRVKLLWTAPDTNCKIARYNLEVSGEVMWRNQIDNNTITIEGNRSSYWLQDLIPYTSYQLWITATSIGGLSSVEYLKVNTTQYKPSEPTELTVIAKSDTNISLEWSEPEEANGDLSYYLVSWKFVDDQNSSRDDITTNTSYTILDLIECSSFLISVSATTDFGNKTGHAANTETMTGPLVPTPPAYNLIVTNVMARSLDISWMRPNTSCEIYNFTLDVIGQINWSNEVSNQTQVIDGVSEYFHVENLIPYTSYNICLIAFSDGGLSEPSCHNYVETLEDAPSAPESVIAEPLSLSEINVTWNESACKNGKNLLYTVRWFKTGLDNDSRLASTSNENYVVQDLSSCIDYNISVTAATDAGSSSSISLIQQAEEEEPPAPTVVMCKASSSSNILVKWNPSSTKCTVKSYKINAIGDVLWKSSSTDSKNETADATNVNLLKLVPYTRYNITIRASTLTEKIGPASTSCIETTFEAAPGPPTKLIATEQQQTKIKISWMPPRNSNGIIQEYHIAFDNRTDIIEISFNDTLPYAYEVAFLEHSTEYQIQVRGKNGAETLGETSELTTKTIAPYSESASFGTIFGFLILLLLIAGFISATYIYRDDIKKKMKILVLATPAAADHLQDVDTLSTIPIQINDLRNHISKFNNAKILETEFRFVCLRSYKGSTVEADRPRNRAKNRYSNILPYDASRVLLRNRSSTYVNASYVSSFSRPNYFIASQAPKENTVSDFWAMIWQENVSIIITLASCEEGGQEKCFRYWPMAYEFKNKTISEYVITNENEESNNYFAARIFEVCNTGLKKERTVKQFHYISWPDFGVPDRVEPMLDFLTTVKKNLHNNYGKILVHCSAGVGRTGVFIGLWNLIEEIDSGRQSVSVPEQVLGLRRQRMMMIQTEEQYLYLHKCILTYCEQVHKWQVKEKKPVAAVRTNHGIAYTNLSFEPTGDKDFAGNLI